MHSIQMCNGIEKSDVLHSKGQKSGLEIMLVEANNNTIKILAAHKKLS